jgi:hypothetical protein
MGWSNGARLAMARQFIRELESRSPGVVELLERTGLGNNSRVIARIVCHCERLNYRAGLKT